MTIKLLGRLPGGEQNGTGPIADSLIRHPERTQLIVLRVDCVKIVTDPTTGDVLPTARIVGAEGIHLDSPAGRLIDEYYREARAERTGRVELPLDGDDV